MGAIVVALQRGGGAERVSLRRVTVDSHENIYRRPGDVVTLVKDPQTFFSYGATANNAEIPFGAGQGRRPAEHAVGRVRLPPPKALQIVDGITAPAEQLTYVTAISTK